MDHAAANPSSQHHAIWMAHMRDLASNVSEILWVKGQQRSFVLYEIYETNENILNILKRDANVDPSDVEKAVEEESKKHVRATSFVKFEDGEIKRELNDFLDGEHDLSGDDQIKSDVGKGDKDSEDEKPPTPKRRGRSHLSSPPNSRLRSRSRSKTRSRMRSRSKISSTLRRYDVNASALKKRRAKLEEKREQQLLEAEAKKKKIVEERLKLQKQLRLKMKERVKRERLKKCFEMINFLSEEGNFEQLNLETMNEIIAFQEEDRENLSFDFDPSAGKIPKKLKRKLDGVEEVESPAKKRIKREIPEMPEGDEDSDIEFPLWKTLEEASRDNLQVTERKAVELDKQTEKALKSCETMMVNMYKSTDKRYGKKIPKKPNHSTIDLLAKLADYYPKRKPASIPKKGKGRGNPQRNRRNGNQRGNYDNRNNDWNRSRNQRRGGGRGGRGRRGRNRRYNDNYNSRRDDRDGGRNRQRERSPNVYRSPPKKNGGKGNR